MGSRRQFFYLKELTQLIESLKELKSIQFYSIKIKKIYKY